MKLWINRNFFLLWVGQFISQVGDKCYNIALAWWIVEKTHSPSLMGLYLFVSMITELLLAPLAGSFIDRWNKKYIIIIADLLRGFVICIIAWISFLGLLKIEHTFITAIFVSISAAFYNPTIMSVIPRVVSKGNLAEANSLSQMVAGITAIIGPVLGGVSVGVVGYGFVFLINGLSYLFSAFLELFIIIKENKRSVIKHKIFDSIKSGIVYIKVNQPVYIILLLIGIVHIFFGSMVVSLPFLAKGLKGNGARILGILEALIGGGIIFGALIYNQVSNSSFKNILYIAVMNMGICFITLGLLYNCDYSNLLPYSIFILGIGISVSVASISWRSILQLMVPEEMTGRVFSIAATVANISLPLSVCFTGFLLEYYDLAGLLVCSGIGMIISTAIITRFLVIGQEIIDSTGLEI